MKKQNKNKTAKAVVTPAAFVRKNTAIAEETPSYDWNTQRNSIVGFASWFQTFTTRWESD